MRRESATEHAIAALADEQHGVVARAQLLSAGLLALCDEHHLPRPEANAIVEGVEVDFVWRERRLVVAVDGYRYRRSPRRFETDREKDVHLITRGWRVLRFTWRQITRRAGWVAAAIGEMPEQPQVSSRPWP
jgi:hypothetical protein